MEQKELHSHAGCVRLVPIFNHLDEEKMAKVASKANHKHVKRGEYIYQAADEDDSIYIVHKGQVRIFHLSESGKEQLIRVLNPGDFTGEWTIFSKDTFHENYAEATRESAICVINRNDLLDLLEDYPEISMVILTTMSQRLQQSEKQTASVATESVLNRIIYFLEDLANGGVEDKMTVKLPMTRKDLASYLGTTPETLSRKFKELEEKDLIQQYPKNEIHIPSIDELLFSIES